jgi:hypothetical protein
MPRHKRRTDQQQAGSGFRRSFTPDSYWNTPYPAGLAVDPHSAEWTARQALLCPPPKLGKPTAAWALPWSEATSADPVVTIRDSKGATVQLAVNVHTGSMTGDDAAIVWRDLGRHIEVATFETVVVRKDGSIDTSKPITCTGFATFDTDTNGIARQVGGPKQNTGHRGVVPSSMALHPDEAHAPILHRLKCSLGPPADNPGPNYPMYGIESPRPGAIPEGATLRYNGPITNVVLQAAHDFGLIVGDTAGGGTSVVKTVQGGDYRSQAERDSGVVVTDAAILRALDATTWDQWDVMELGWK